MLEKLQLKKLWTFQIIEDRVVINASVYCRCIYLSTHIKFWNMDIEMLKINLHKIVVFKLLLYTQIEH